MTGGKLKNTEGIAVDPLEGNRESQKRQKQNFHQILKSDKDIFVAVMKKNSVLENAIACFQNLTLDYRRTMILCNLIYISLFEKIAARRILQILIPVAFNFTHSRLFYNSHEI